MNFKKILVAIKGSAIDERIIRLACNLAKQNSGKVYVAYVIQLDRSLPLDAEVPPEVEKGEEILDAAECYAENYGCEIITDLLQARAVGPALINEASEREADLLIIGMDYKTQFGEFSLGEVAPYVLKHASCQVMLLRESEPEIE